MADFDKSIGFILQNEGGFSNDALDRGGATNWGITAMEAANHGFDVATLTLDQAKAIYRADYWKFDGLADQRVATKVLDIVVNQGLDGGTRVIQGAVGAIEDGVWGPATEAALNALDPEDAIEKMSMSQSDRYVAICIHNPSQWKWARGWLRRAIRRPKGV